MAATDQDLLEEKIQNVRRRDRRFSRNSYYFVLDALDYTMTHFGRDRLTGEDRHVGGKELLVGIKEYAAEQFGPMAAIVFERWGVQQCRRLRRDRLQPDRRRTAQPPSVRQPPRLRRRHRLPRDCSTRSTASLSNASRRASPDSSPLTCRARPHHARCRVRRCALADRPLRGLPQLAQRRYRAASASFGPSLPARDSEPLGGAAGEISGPCSTLGVTRSTGRAVREDACESLPRACDCAWVIEIRFRGGTSPVRFRCVLYTGKKAAAANRVQYGAAPGAPMSQSSHRVFSLSLILTCLLAKSAWAQADGWLQPSNVITKVVTASPPSGASVSPQTHLSGADDARGLAGARGAVAPAPEAGGHAHRWRDMGAAARHKSHRDQDVQTLPQAGVHHVPIEAGHWSGPIWSADERAFALTRSVAGGAELWVCRSVRRRAEEGRRPAAQPACCVVPSGGCPTRSGCWCKQVLPGERAAASRRVPGGPIVQQTKQRVKAQVRTYQDLLQDDHDADLLAHYGNSQLAIVDAATRTVQPLGEPAMYSRVSPSPDGTLLLVEKIERPFSFVVPVYRFPKTPRWCSTSTARSCARLWRDELQRGGADRRRQARPARHRVDSRPRSMRCTGAKRRTTAIRSARSPHRDQVFLLAEPSGHAAALVQAPSSAPAACSSTPTVSFVLDREYDRQTRSERIWRRDLDKFAASNRASWSTNARRRTSTAIRDARCVSGWSTAARCCGPATASSICRGNGASPKWRPTVPGQLGRRRRRQAAPVPVRGGPPTRRSSPSRASATISCWCASEARSEPPAAGARQSPHRRAHRAAHVRGRVGQVDAGTSRSASCAISARTACR